MRQLRTLVLVLLSAMSCDSRTFWGDTFIEDRTKLCMVDQDCAAEPLKFCDKAQGKCSGCKEDTQCAARNVNEPFCDKNAGGICGSKCTKNEQCQARNVAMPTCGEGGVCRGCTNDGECQGTTTPYCERPTQTCRGCKDNAECLATPGTGINKPICEPSTKVCRECQANADCTSGLCMGALTVVDVNANGKLVFAAEAGKAGSCASSDQIAYVQKPAGCMDGGKTGNIDQPYCEIQTAVSMLGTKKYILARSPTADFSPISVSGGTAMIFGPWVDPKLSGTDWDMDPTSATIKGSVTVTGQAILLIDGFKISPNSGDVGVNCSGSQSVLITNRSRVEGGRIGIASSGSGCQTLGVHRTRVLGARDFGISVGAGTYEIDNTVVSDTSSINATNAGVFIAALAEGSFRFNTIVKNTAGGSGAGGVSCEMSATMKTLSDSIVFNNSKSGNSQVLRCKPDRLLVGIGDSLPGADNMADPSLVDGSFKLMGDQVCCNSKGQLGTPALGIDFYGNRRPGAKRMSPTLGFHEPQ